MFVALGQPPGNMSEPMQWRLNQSHGTSSIFMNMKIAFNALTMHNKARIKAFACDKPIAIVQHEHIQFARA